jgi:uncharacterized protein YbjT (DUF2867 family)
MAQRTAVIIGATGAVGRKLTPLIVASPRYDRVVILHRRTTPFARLAKVEERIGKLGTLEALVSGLKPEAVFCCIGTTQKIAGSTAAFQAIDRDIPVSLARWASGAGANVFLVVSSIGADARARSVYMRTKGEMEEGVKSAGLRSSYILRPALLKGERDEFRLAERIGNRALAIVDPVMIGPLKKYRAMPTETLARAMLACAEEAKPGVHVLESDVIQELGTPLGLSARRA